MDTKKCLEWLYEQKAKSEESIEFNKRGIEREKKEVDILKELIKTLEEQSQIETAPVNHS